jgi:hypothetical protein
MKQQALLQEAALQSRGNKQRHDTSRIGPLLGWVVVFADAGTLMYYIHPGHLLWKRGKPGRLLCDADEPGTKH